MYCFVCKLNAECGGGVFLFVLFFVNTILMPLK